MFYKLIYGIPIVCVLLSMVLMWHHKVALLLWMWGILGLIFIVGGLYLWYLYQRSQPR